ncbi:MAG: hypothetical protein ACTHJ0_10545 [Flavipsychrobacter sp.]
MSLSTILSAIGTIWRELWGKMPDDYKQATEDAINGLNTAKAFLTNPLVISIAALFPKGIGGIVDTALVNVINKVLPELEIGKDCEAALQAYIIAHPAANEQEKATVILQTIIQNIGKLPASWQDKHWLDIAVSILIAILGITKTEANTLVSLSYAQMKKTN